MSGRDLKVQLGVRVPKDVRGAAVAKAQLQGESLNAYVERLIVQDVGGQPSIAPVPEQLTIEQQEQRAEAAALAQIGARFDDDGDSFPDSIAGEAAEAEGRKPALKVFARNCRNGTYHWKHGPGNPCAYCGGEI